MIFVTLGTHAQPFERALDLVLPCRGTELLVVQHGHTASRPHEHGVRWSQFMDYSGVLSLCAEARAVVAHAGVGSIMTVFAAGKTPIVIPRLARHREHVDDHQMQIAVEFHKLGLVKALLDEDDLRSLIEQGSTAPPRGAQGQPPLVAAIADDVRRHLARLEGREGAD